MILQLYEKINEVTAKKFPDIIESNEVIYSSEGRPRKIRLHLIDSSFIDICCSRKGSYSYHWERRHLDNTIYRHDNAPHKSWRNVKTFPQHFHYRSELNVIESSIPLVLEEAVNSFLAFCRKTIAP